MISKYQNKISTCGLVVECVLATDETRIRFPAGADLIIY